MKHTASFGGEDHSFVLTFEMIVELERVTGASLAALYRRTMQLADFSFTDLTEIIRLGLIGAGTAPQIAQRLVDTYAKNRPVMEIFPLAADVLDLAWNGPPTVAAPANDMTAINESLKESGL